MTGIEKVFCKIENLIVSVLQALIFTLLALHIINMHIVACGPVARQGPQSKQLYNSCFLVTALPTDMHATIPRQQLHCNRVAVFSTRSVLRYYKQNKLVSCDGERVSQERVCRQVGGRAGCQAVVELVSE
jgi:hypothetical protein